jgi:DNA mismatch repair protein MutH
MQLRHLTQCVVDLLRKIEFVIECLAERCYSVKLKWQPQPEPAIRTRQLWAEICEIGQVHTISA